MKRVYVAGAYSADNVIDVLKNIGRGESYAATIFSLGFAPFSPWSDKDFIIKRWQDDFSIKEFYDYSVVWLMVSEIMFLVPGYKDSAGTMAEMVIAREMGIPIVETFDELMELKKDDKEVDK